MRHVSQLKPAQFDPGISEFPLGIDSIIFQFLYHLSQMQNTHSYIDLKNVLYYWTTKLEPYYTILAKAHFRPQYLNQRSDEKCKFVRVTIRDPLLVVHNLSGGMNASCGNAYTTPLFVNSSYNKPTNTSTIMTISIRCNCATTVFHFVDFF